MALTATISKDITTRSPLPRHISQIAFRSHPGTSGITNPSPIILSTSHVPSSSARQNRARACGLPTAKTLYITSLSFPILPYSPKKIQPSSRNPQPVGNVKPLHGTYVPQYPHHRVCTATFIFLQSKRFILRPRTTHPSSCGLPRARLLPKTTVSPPT